MINVKSIQVLLVLVLLQLLGFRITGFAGGTGENDPVTKRLLGTWVVSAVRVSSGGVQAYAEDDRTFMKKRLIISPTEIKFLNQNCRGPRYIVTQQSVASWFDKTFGSTPKEFNVSVDAKIPLRLIRISCKSGNIGPDALGNSTIAILPKEQLGMNYFDNVLLIFAATK